ALQSYGLRAVPSLRYLYRQPSFSIGPDNSEDNDSAPSIHAQAKRAMGHARVLKNAGKPDAASMNLVPRGGLFWDGRANTLQQQAAGPLFNPAEMDAGSPADVAAKIEKFDYAKRFTLLFGPNIFEDPKQVVAEAMFALSRFQIEDQSFHPFSSKYDAWLRGRARFTPAELRGYLAFNDPERGNCAACHLDRPTRDNLPPLFTDFQYEALGVPRNPAIPANLEKDFHDLGICGPVRTDMKTESQYCGMFLTPSLRNVAVRRVFFHNGVFHSLEEALDWYVNRDLHSERFYPRDSSGKVVKFDDLPSKIRKNVDTVDAPFDRRPGDKPALSREEVRDIISFLNTLTDGYVKSRQAVPARW
ncbi:MAG TPA: cytochrome c peroxidase, partial [Burkholderiales bacterium]|nr:cytochrome c peroxidase [Burkholderiales bacterium]